MDAGPLLAGRFLMLAIPRGLARTYIRIAATPAPRRPAPGIDRRGSGATCWDFTAQGRHRGSVASRRGFRSSSHARAPKFHSAGLV